jgi:hypothetical protein
VYIKEKQISDMKKICLIRQPAGLGDIFFLQKAAYLVAQAGYKILWPIKDQFSFLKNYIKVPHIEFIEESNEFSYKEIYQTERTIIDSEELLYLPFQYADMFYTGCFQKAKYAMIDSDYSDWYNYLLFIRNKEKEYELYYNILKLKDDIEYNFVNKNYGSFPNYVQKNEVVSKNNLPDIKMQDIEGYTIFDWLYVIENASNIYTVDTSLLYLIDNLELKARNGDIELWSRVNHYNNIDGLFKTKYKQN